MNIGIKLTPEEIISYARHRVMQVNLSDLGLADYRSWNERFIDIRPVKTIWSAGYFWKRGRIEGIRLKNPRLYVASVDFKEPRLPKDREAVAYPERIQGFKLMLDAKESDNFWRVEPVYL